MGFTRWDPQQFAAKVQAGTVGKSRAQVFASRGLPDEFDPSKFKRRESRDSPANPRSLAIEIFSDVTGSMGETAEDMVRGKMDTTMRELYARMPGYDPHIMMGATGDAYVDTAPLQMSQYESGVVLGDALRRIYLEGGGGGNGGESYMLAHYGIGTKTSIDCYERRGQKGILFTMGDEPMHDELTGDQIRRVFGGEATPTLSAADCVSLAQRTHEVFHIVLADVSGSSLPSVMRSWTPLLGERVLVLDDTSKVAELVVSTCQIVTGADPGAVSGSWAGGTARSVGRALAPLAARGLAKPSPSSGVVRFR